MLAAERHTVRLLHYGTDGWLLRIDRYSRSYRAGREAGIDPPVQSDTYVWDEFGRPKSLKSEFAMGAPQATYYYGCP